MKTTLSIFFLSIHTVTAGAAPLTLAGAEQAVLSSHPAMRAAHARWLAARERVPQAKAWADPMMGTTLMQDREMRSGLAMAEWMVTQEIPLSGMPKARERVAEAEAAMAYEEVGRVRAELLMRTRTAFVAYASAHQRLALNDQNLKILEDIIAITQKKIETGEAMLADALQAQTEAGMLKDKRADLERERVQARVQLNTLMQRPVDAALGEPAPLMFEPMKETAAQMAAQALEHRPDLLIAQLQVEADTQKIDLARREQRPDPSVLLAGRQFSGEGFGIQEFDVGLSIPLKFFNRRKYTAAVREAEAMRAASAELLEVTRLETRQMVGEKYEEASAAAKQYLILRDQVVPQAQKALDARAADFAARKATFLEYNAARLLLQTAQIELFDRLAAYHAARAELRTITQPHPVPAPVAPEAAPRH